MDQMMVIAAILGLGPALLLMYLVLRKYTYPAVESPFFSDPTFFGLFVVGLISGTVIFVAYTFFVGSWGSLLVAVSFALIFELVKLVVLNLRRFHGKSDTIFYGYGLGLGMGCTMAFGMIFYVASQTASVFGGEVELSSWILLIIIGMTYIFLNASTGTTIGEGIARRRPWEFLLQAVIMSLIVMMLMIPIFLSLSSESLWYHLSYVSLAAALVLSMIFFYRTHFIGLPAIVREILRNESRRSKDDQGTR